MEVPHQSQNRDPILIQDMVPIFKQHNYTNLFFQTASKHLTRIEDTINHIKNGCHLQPNSEVKTEVIPVTIKPPLEVTKFKLSSTKKDIEFKDTLVDKIKSFKIGESSSINMLSTQHNPNEENLTLSQTTEIENNYQENPTFINIVHYGETSRNSTRTATMRYYHP